MRQQISRGPDFEKLLNYSRVVVDDEGWVFASRPFRLQLRTMTIGQHQGPSQADVRKPEVRPRASRLHIRERVSRQGHRADASGYRAAARVISAHSSDVMPANTTWIVELPDPRIKIEIEATARQ